MLIQPEEPLLDESLVELLDDPQRRMRMAEAARRRASQFTTSGAARIYAHFLAGLLTDGLGMPQE